MKETCRKCGYEIDAYTHAHGNAKPRPGDVSFCLNCGALSVFTKDMTLRAPTTEENAKFQRDQRVIDVQIARAAVVGDTIKQRNGLA